MFVITQSTTYKWPVDIEVPVDGGKFDKQTFDAEFKRISQARIDEISADAANLKDKLLAKEVLVGWDGINDAAGNVVPYSEGMRDKLLDIPKVATSVCRAFIGSLQGAQRKN